MNLYGYTNGDLLNLDPPEDNRDVLLRVDVPEDEHGCWVVARYEDDQWVVPASGRPLSDGLNLCVPGPFARGFEVVVLGWIELPY